MLLEQFYLESLGHASYLVGSEETGEALVLDPRRDVDAYFATARRQGLRIRYAADTHQHNDYVSGITELPQRGDVRLMASARAELGYAVRPLNDGERVRMGEVIIEAMHTPGHTPEHMSFLLYDLSRGEVPAVLLSGGALLVGDVARPDLLGGAEETRRHAEQFCNTLQEKILKLPDHVEVYPTHVAGSLCGGSIGSRLSTTVGYERRMNPLLADIASKDGFVRGCLDLEHLPAVPPYWPRMRRINTRGAAPLGVVPEPPALTVTEFERARDEGALVLDCRPAEAFAAHIPGALHVELGPAFPTWAGTVLPPDRPLVLLLDAPEDLWEAVWHLLRIGYDVPRGWLAGGMRAWRVAGREIERLPQWTVEELDNRMKQDQALLVLDVRQPQEWAGGHIPGAHFITGAELPGRIEEVPADRPVATVCGSGLRSSVAAGLLQAHGHRQVFNVLGGMRAWKSLGLPLEDAGK